MIQTAFLRYNPHIKNNLNFTKFHHVRQYNPAEIESKHYQNWEEQAISSLIWI